MIPCPLDSSPGQGTLEGRRSYGDPKRRMSLHDIVASLRGKDTDCLLPVRLQPAWTLTYRAPLALLSHVCQRLPGSLYPNY